MFIVIVIWTVLLYIAQGAHIQGPTSHEFIFLVSFISAIILLLIVCSILALIECFYVKRMFIKKKEFLERDESVFEYPIRKFADFRLSKYLSNQKIRQWTCFLLVVIALILPFSLIFNHIVTTNQKEFQVYRDDAIGEVYVLVYRADNVYYFDKAKESDTETITVYTNSQRIIKADDIVLETTKYNIVHRE